MYRIPPKHQRDCLVSYWHTRVKLAFLRRRLKKQRRSLVAINLTEHMGDIIACEPVARHIRLQHPNGYIIWTTRPQYSELLVGNPALDLIVPVFCLTEWIRLRKLRLFDVIVDLHPSGRACPVCDIPLRKTEGDQKITLQNYYEHGNLLSVMSRSAGLPALSGQPKIYIPNSARQCVERLELPKKFCVVHCRSNEKDRDWTKPKWTELVMQIQRRLQCSIIELGIDSLLGDVECVQNLCNKLHVMETAEVIARASLFIGVDSGLAHIANAVGTPGVVLMGHYRRFKRYCPYSGAYQDGRNAHLVQYDGPMAELPTEEVWEAIQERWRISTTILHKKKVTDVGR